MTVATTLTNTLGLGFSPGDHHYRTEKYDLVSAMQFSLLTVLGFREDRFLPLMSILSHSFVEQICHCLDEARKVLTSSSIFAATFAEEEINYSGNEWVYPGCIHYTHDFFFDLVEQAGLRCSRLDRSHPNSQTWVAITHPGMAPIPNIADLAQSDNLHKELDACRQQIKKASSHPYVKFGLHVRNLFRKIGILHS